MLSIKNKIIEFLSNKTCSEDIQAECVKVLYKHAYIILAGNLASSSGLGLMFYEHTSSDKVVIWVSAIYLLSVIRVWVVKKFHRHERNTSEIIKWGKYLSVTSLISGFLWGAASFVFFTPENFLLLAFFTMIVTAMLVASISSLSAVLFAYYSYAIPAGLMLVYQYAAYGTYQYFLFGVLLLVYLLIQLGYAKINNRTLIESITLRFDNIDLIKQLQHQKNKAEDALIIAEHANRSKTKFLAAASHDLRQPLHALGLFIGVMQSVIKSREQQDILNKIIKSNDALRGLLDSLLDISKIDANTIQPEHVPFSIRDMLKSLWHEFKPFADKKNIKLKFHDTSVWVISDYKIVERILRNLIANAIRYTNKGGVLAGVRYRGNQVCLAVYDTGIGIPPDKITKIYTEFCQLNNPERDREKGLGLGLAIVKRLANVLGSPIQQSSIAQQGSVFSIQLPRCEPEKAPQQQTYYWNSNNSFARKRILVIDDETDILDSLHALLTNWQCRVITASSGEEALEKILYHQEPPDMALVDYRLRDNKTGIEVVNILKELYPEHHIPTIIITGDTDPERIKEIESTDYKLLYKPVSASKLRSMMQYCLSDKSN